MVANHSSNNRAVSAVPEYACHCATIVCRVLQVTFNNSLSINPFKTKKLSVFVGTRARRVMLDSGLSFGNHVDVVYGKVWGALAGIYSTNMHPPFRIKRSFGEQNSFKINQHKSEIN
uniref:Uncharacterized protein n=1 Tax=Glossina austeni TaxID=7395 RepID=A0A1A9VI72_GLOAU